MAKFTWQDGTLVSKAKVEVGGTIYEVDPEEYSGATPLSASNLNAMQDGIYEDINNVAQNGTGYLKLADGTLICYGKTASANINANSEYQENITLPQNYVDSNFIVLASIGGGATGWAQIIARGQATSNDAIRIIGGNYITGSSRAQGIVINYITIGKWK